MAIFKIKQEYFNKHWKADHFFFKATEEGIFKVVRKSLRKNSTWEDRTIQWKDSWQIRNKFFKNKTNMMFDAIPIFIKRYKTKNRNILEQGFTKIWRLVIYLPLYDLYHCKIVKMETEDGSKFEILK